MTSLAHDTAVYIHTVINPRHARHVREVYGDTPTPVCDAPATVQEITSDLLRGDMWTSWIDHEDDKDQRGDGRIVRAIAALVGGPPTGISDCRCGVMVPGKQLVCAVWNPPLARGGGSR